MPLLRKITKAKWYDDESIPVGEIQADALTDLRTDKNALSVWSVELDESSLAAVIAALASNKTAHVSKVDYVLLDDDVIARLDLRPVKSDGDSPHHEANTRWHLDLTGLTVSKIAGLAREVK